MFSRHLEGQIKGHFQNYREILILLGARQTGKTTLLKRIFPDATYLLVDNEPIRQILETYDINAYQTILPQDNQALIIDELHLVHDPGRVAKIIYDQKPSLKLIISGSSSFHLKNKTPESLAGRKIDYQLFPLTFSEYLYQNSIEAALNFSIWENVLNCTGRILPHQFDLKAVLENVLIYGLYPGMVNYPQDQRYLLNLVDSILFKDLLDLQLIENRRLALQLLKLLTHQIGGLLNYSEVANRLKADVRTVQRYIEIFEQNFVLYRLYPYSNNPRTETTKMPKKFFYDNGIRNALIENFSPLIERADLGALFENFIVSEVMKANSYLGAGYKLHYWRDKQNSEVDLVLIKGEELLGVEIKYNQLKFSHSFKNKYPKAKYHNVTMQNFY